MEARPPIKIHILHCGTVSVSPSVPEGGLSLGGALGGVFCPESRRVALPVSCYLIEHPADREGCLSIPASAVSPMSGSPA